MRSRSTSNRHLAHPIDVNSASKFSPFLTGALYTPHMLITQDLDFATDGQD